MRRLAGLSNSLICNSIIGFIAISIILKILPLQLNFPASGIDNSWRFAMNQAMAQGLIFGRDIIFTFGPYASVYTKLYHPATYGLMLLGSMIFLLGFFAAVLRLISYQKIFVTLGLVLAWILTNNSDALIFSYIMLYVGIIYCERTTAASYEKLSFFKISTAILLLLPFGLFPLIKFSFLLVTFPILSLTILFSLCNKNRLLAFLTCLIPAITLCLLWVASHQPLLALFPYFSNGIDIVLGYSDAMSLYGNIFETIFYIFCAGILLTMILFAQSISGSLKSYLFLSFSFLLFVAFKEGFVRHDGHALIAACSLLFAIMTSAIFLRPRILYYSLLAAGIVNWAYTANDYGFINNIPSQIKNFKDFYSSSVSGLKETFSLHGDFSEKFNSSIAQIKRATPLPMLLGSSDIYPVDQSELIASGNKWSPRPIIQSYSAYTNELLLLNSHSLEKPDAPDNILFKLQPIDGKLPAIDDSRSWLAIMSNYHIDQFTQNIVFLKKNTSPVIINKPKLLSISEYQFNENISLKENNQILFANIKLSPTWLGKLISLIYKTPPIEISLILESGRVVHYRLVPKIAASGFILSPFVENSTDFVLLNTHNSVNFMEHNKVKSFKIATHGKLSFLWQEKFLLELSGVEVLNKINIGSIGFFNKYDFTLDSKPVVISKDCNSSIDGINSTVITKAPFTLSPGILSIDGWALMSTKNKEYADAVFITLTDINGNIKYITTNRIFRKDVNDTFGILNDRNVGFSSWIDTSNLQGKFLVGLTRLYKNHLYSCEQYKIPIIITP